MKTPFETGLPEFRSGFARRGMEIALRALGEIGPPVYYADHERSIAESMRLLKESPVAAECFEHTGNVTENMGHGAWHSKTVAVEAGAIALIESAGNGFSAEAAARCVRLSHVAGLLHDIRRREREHAAAGAVAAERILEKLGFADADRDVVTAAIANHEAFRQPAPATDPEAGLVSDALYDADKFRWGPDNFTVTIWHMVESAGIPLKPIVASYPEKIKGVERIKETFRTATGRKYGPDFIDRGLRIGEIMIDQLAAEFLK